MNSSVIFTIGALAIAVICFLAALIFIMRALGARSQKQAESYNFGRQETQNSILRNALLGLIMLLLGVICVGIYMLRPFGGDESPEVVEPVQEVQPTVVVPTQMPVTLQPPLPDALPLPVQMPQDKLPTPPPTKTPAPTAVPEEEAPAEEAPPPLENVRVSAEVGVWLRAEPTTTQQNQIEHVRYNSVMEVFPGVENADGYQWQQVRSEAGNVGWVATQFIEAVE